MLLTGRAVQRGLGSLTEGPWAPEERILPQLAAKVKGKAGISASVLPDTVAVGRAIN
jgi:hypothetical protein